MEFLQALKSRHSEYVLSKNIDITEDALTSYLKDILQYTPSAFNSESQRIVLLTQEKHDLLWDQLIEIMKGIVKGEQFENTKNKLNAFKAAYGTILFFDDTSVTKKLQEKFPLYSENFAKWSIEQNGMLQSNVWVGLRTKNIGASLVTDTKSLTIDGYNKIYLLVNPIDFDKISVIPASSNTARTGPPAITPVPSEAGFKKTLPAPYTPVTSCGIVVPTEGTIIKFVFAASIAFLIAAGTSDALPVPKPTWP